MRSDRAEPAHDHSHEQNRFAVIPTAEKLNADPAYAGGGVTIAFLDSGFYPHPDFASRVVAFHDISGEEQSLYDIAEPQAHHWHGTQTVAACAGDGCLSDGVYRGLAYKANLVLVKVSRNGSIGNKEIEDGLVWVMENRSKFGIRILNMSLGGDRDEPTAESTINQLVEQLIMDGVVVTVAAGNSSDVRSIPPASAPSAITVGGYSDENKFSPEDFDLYHSSHGLTKDGLVKPELIAPAMYIAAPILPGTSTYESRGMDSMTFGPSPLLTWSRMIVSVRWPLAAPVPRSCCCACVRPSRLSEPTSRYVVPGPSAGRAPLGSASTLATLDHA